jgi:Mrp family chromosome partitioning ATPase
MRSVMARLAASAEFVVIDSPPLQAVTDAAILSALVDGTVLVIDAGRTRRGAARNGREALTKVGARVLGVTLNRLSEAMSGDYYYYDYYGGYGTDTKGKNQKKDKSRQTGPSVAPTELGPNRT